MSKPIRNLETFFAAPEGKSWRQSPLQVMKGSDKKKRVEDYEVSRASEQGDRRSTHRSDSLATCWAREPLEL